MLKVQNFVKKSANVAIAIIVPCIISQTALTQTPASSDIRINSIRLEETLVAEAMNGYIEVPDRNTTASAYGSKMRLYDVHIARMIALSHYFYCQQPYVDGIEKVMQWEYRANNGRINMGTFSLRCTQVEQVVKSYGLGRAVPMQVQLGDGVQQNVRVPILDIQGEEETNRFLNFVQTLKPQQ